ncbi:MAG: FAD-dependent thymidylate synthase [Chloroflexi bacterium]|nr:FAD-dependent thymidylate synthase [Chloroflexota bacterium]
MSSSTREDPQALVGQELKVHNAGFVRLIDFMGDDAAIIAAARVSYGAGTRSIRTHRGLIRYLMRNRHTSPFEMVELKFHIKAPIFVERQWFRHRTASINSISQRYSEMREEFFIPEPYAIRPQSETNRQGRAEEPMLQETAQWAIEQWQKVNHETYSLYHQLLEVGMSRELARIDLPLSLYTEWYWKINLHNCLHFLSLRLDPHAQEEIRDYAQVIARCVRAIAPITYEAFEDYVLDAVTFSKTEMQLLQKLLRGEQLTSDDLDHGETWRREFERKLGQPLDILVSTDGSLS